ncbi:MAG: M23 family metallopeptidase [Thermoleophilia bacterium]|nr:M23 family metallopeptidase [Thermoleophilia bacterium]
MRRLVLMFVVLAALVAAPQSWAWTWPLSGAVLRPYSLGPDPYAAGQHRGIDIAGVRGDPVRAPAAGTISFAGVVPSSGRTVTIQTEGYAVSLTHLGEFSVVKGDSVSEGYVIGTAGTSGDPEWPLPYVHLGIRVSSAADGYVDPATLLPPRAVVPPPVPVTETPATVPVPTPVVTPVPVVIPGTPEVIPGTPEVIPGTPAPGPSVALPAATATAAPRGAVSAVTDPTTAVVVPVLAAVSGSVGRSPILSGGRPERSSHVTPRVTLHGLDSRPSQTLDPSVRPPTHAPSVVADAAAPGRDGVLRDAGGAEVAVVPGLQRRPVRDPRSASVRPVGAPSMAAPVAASPPSPRPQDHSVAPHPGSPSVAFRDVSHLANAVRSGRSDERGRNVCTVALGLVFLLLVGVVAAVLARHRRIDSHGALLHHDTDLLRQLDAAHRARLHDDCGGHPRAEPATAWRRDVLSDRRRRARREGRPGRRGAGSVTAGVRRPDRGRLA